MKIKSNAHTHSTFCDGKSTVEEMVETALAKGFTALGFSGHSHLAFDPEYSMSLTDTLLYQKAVLAAQEKYKGQISIHLGIEQDSFSETSTEPYSYVIGSVHYIKGPLDGVLYPVDSDHETLTACLKNGFGGDREAMIKAYYQSVAEMVKRTKPTIVGHFDLIRKLNRGDRYFREKSPFYQTTALSALESCGRSPIYEINTGGAYRGYRSTPYPDDFLLRAAKELGYRLTVSSDAHEAAAIDFGLDQAADRLISFGFKSITLLGASGFEEVPLF